MSSLGEALLVFRTLIPFSFGVPKCLLLPSFLPLLKVRTPSAVTIAEAIVHISLTMHSRPADPLFVIEYERLEPRFQLTAPF